jgi:hypothetical protein
VEVAEDFLGPQIDAAFSGIAMGQFDDGDALRPEKEQQGNDPEPDCDAAVGRDGWNDVQIEDGDYEEQNQVPAAKDALQVRMIGVLRIG